MASFRLNVEQVAAREQVSVRCVRLWCKTGILGPGATKVGRDWVISGTYRLRRPTRTAAWSKESAER